ncbi:DUF3761 domain-containing protein [Streptomyces sp. NPDC004266]|uniref:DUF3761 domain-containing protein n=1 Tax=Streptomyces sp. NPDC004266 TaxID=3364693 RepID=UPI00369EC0EB
MARNQRPQPTAEDKKNFRVGCGFMLAMLLVVGGCSALFNDDNDSSSASSSSSTSPSVLDDKAATVTVGDFVGMELQAAQDAAQADGIYNLDSTDATGLGRQQFLDRNWTVCSQQPVAGATMSADDTLTFDTVKSSEGETCDDPTGAGSSDESSTVSGTEDDYSDDGSSTASGTGDDSDSSSSTASGSGDDYSDDSSSSGSSSSTGSSFSGSDTSSSSSGSGSSSSSPSGDSQQAPAGATAQCNDGSYSYSAHRRGTCSHHGGVAVWLASVPS